MSEPRYDAEGANDPRTGTIMPPVCDGLPPTWRLMLGYAALFLLGSPAAFLIVAGITLGLLALFIGVSQ